MRRSRRREGTATQGNGNRYHLHFVRDPPPRSECNSASVVSPPRSEKRSSGRTRDSVLHGALLLAVLLLVVAGDTFRYRDALELELAVDAGPIETPVWYGDRNTHGLVWDWHRGVVYRGETLAVLGLPTCLPAAAYYPQFDVLVGVEPDGSVALYRRGTRQLVKWWLWHPDEPFVELLQVAFTPVPGLVYVKGRDANQANDYLDKPTQQSPMATTYRVAVAPYAAALHAAPWPFGDRERWRADSWGVFRVTSRRSA